MKTNIIHLFFEKGNFMTCFYWITFGLYIVNVILNPLCKKSKEERSIKKTQKNESEHSLFVVIMILFVFVAITLIKPIRIIISFFSLFYIIYIFIITPIFDLPLKIVKDNNYIIYTDDYLLLSYLILINIYSFSSNDVLNKIYSLSKNEYIIQVIIIFALLIISFCMIYILAINLYWFIFHINTLILDKFNKKLKHFIAITQEKYGIGNYEKVVKKEYSLKKIGIFIKLTFKLMLSILTDIIMINILNVVSIIIDCILKVTNNSRNILYRISKLSIITSMFLTYVIIQINNSFNPSIISIYELILTAIIIPIILEKLLVQKAKDDIYK